MKPSMRSRVHDYLKKYPGQGISVSEMSRALGITGQQVYNAICGLRDDQPRCGITCKDGRYTWTDPFAAMRESRRRADMDQDRSSLAIASEEQTQRLPSATVRLPDGDVRYTGRGCVVGSLFSVRAFNQLGFPLLEDEEGQRGCVVITEELLAALIAEHRDFGAVRAFKKSLQHLVRER